MPELPDLLYVRARLEEAFVGKTVEATRLRKPVVLRCLVPGDLDRLIGQTLRRVERRLHFLVFGFDSHSLVVNPMLAGRFRMAAADGSRQAAALAFELMFEATTTGSDARRGLPAEQRGRSGGRDASALQYIDDKQMGKAYLTEETSIKKIPGFAAHGVDVLSPDFTRERFAAMVGKRRDQVRVFLMDKDALDSLGNAYADEVLFAAGIHPKTWCRSLTPDDAARLHAAIVGVLREAIDEVERRGQPTETKVRDFLKVRMKDACPRCGGKIRRAGVRGMDAYFCPHCQPATRDALVDWTRTGR